jgi:hypothetical protein
MNAGDGSPVDATGNLVFVDPYGGAYGCDSGVRTGPESCELLMPVSGALAGTLYQSGSFGCNWGNASNGAPLSIGIQFNGPPWAGTTVSLVPSTPIIAGRIGPISSVAVVLDAVGQDGGRTTWLTPPTCTIEVASNACAPSAATPGLYVISGTGTCMQPATAYGGSAAPSVTVGDFDFALEFDALSSDQ